MSESSEPVRALRKDPAPPSELPPPEAQAAQKAQPMSSRNKLIIVIVAIVAVVAGVSYWLYERNFEDTDDAQIDGNISNLSSRVQGTVKAVYVEENQTVKAGQVLAELDPTDLEVALAQAKAQVAQAAAQLQAEDPSVPITQSSNRATLSTAGSDVLSAQAAISESKNSVAQLAAQLLEAQANDKNSQLIRQRAEQLLPDRAIAKQDYDQRVAQAQASAANVEAIRQSLAAAKDRVLQAEAKEASSRTHVAEVAANAPRQLATRRASVLYRQGQLDLAQAQLKEAENNVAYAKITSPVDGIVGRKSVNVGDRVAPGQQLLAISQVNSLWVTANFRETQLEHLKIGDKAELYVDAIHLDLHGEVESVGGATGSRYSVLPPENASGNYVKVVQRIPVRIKIDAGQRDMDRLRPGMSVEPKVRVR
jgi:membrane fusion protein (multidrug efflux system)